MALIPLKIPAGIFKNGTEFENSGQWRDANLVRWVQGSLRPVGGWVLRNLNVDPLNLPYSDGNYGSNYFGGRSAMNEPPRGMLAWLDNSYDSRIVIGSANVLYAVDHDGDSYDISPTGMAVARVDADTNQAFGGFTFGTAKFGVKRPDTGAILEATTWALDTWGEYLVACSSTDGKIYEWQLNTAVDPAAITNAPINNKSIVVTEERFLFALASGGNPRKIAWCDREDNTTWTPAATNEAGDIELQTQGKIQCGLRMRGLTLILTDEDAHIATYQGAPYVYGFQRVGTSCGVVARKAATQAGAGAFWMGKGAFFAFDGSSVQKLPCTVTDYVFDDINSSQVSKTYAVHNSKFGEVWWFYPSNGSLENDRYVVFNYAENYWNVGEIRRTAGVDSGVYDYPIWSDWDGNLYSHENGHRHEDRSTAYSYNVFVESSPISLGNGDQVMKVNSLIPDEETQGNVLVSFKTRFHPNDTERTYGKYDPSNPTSVRFTGRQVRMRIDGTHLDATDTEVATTGDWRVGVMRIEANGGGKR
jgi:hypothetical protein